LILVCDPVLGDNGKLVCC